MVVQSYKDGAFKVSGNIYQGNALVFPDKVIAWDAAADIETLTEKDFQPIIDAKNDNAFDVLLIGTGADFKFLKPELKAYLQKHGIAPEMMNTGAACRTFNVLISEGRSVCAALCAL